MSAKPIYSMTGFCSGEIKLDTQYRFHFEIRSLNHRFIDVKIRTPKDAGLLDNIIREQIQNAFTRGSFDIRIELVKEKSGQAPDYRFNQSIADSYLKDISSFMDQDKKAAAPLVFNFPDVIERNEAEVLNFSDPQKTWKIIESDFMNALTQLKKMRNAEGNALAIDLNEKIAQLKGHLTTIESLRAEWKALAETKITQKIEKIFESNPIENLGIQEILTSRVSQELAILADKTDVEEEIKRLHGHYQHFIDTMKTGNPIGRKLDFLIQEMNREVNTLGNKAQDLGLSMEVVQSKVLLEQLREQVMNIE